MRLLNTSESVLECGLLDYPMRLSEAFEVGPDVLKRGQQGRILERA